MTIPGYPAQLRVKQETLRRLYGGMMTLSEVSRELGYRSRTAARDWLESHMVPEVLIGVVPRYESDVVAKVIVDSRIYPTKKRKDDCNG